MKQSIQISAIALMLISSSSFAFDFKKLVGDVVKDTAEDIVKGNVNDAADIVKDLIPSISDYKVEKAKPTADMDWVETNQNIVVYSTQSCGYCVRLRKYLVSNNIPFIEKDVNSDDQWRAEFTALKGKGVPLSLVKSNLVSGFSDENWDSLLAEHGFK